MAGDVKGGAWSKIKALSEVRAGPRVVQMFKEVKAQERAVRVCAQRGVCPVSPIDVAAPGRDPAGAAGSPVPRWPPVPREPCTAGQCIR